MVWFPCDDGLMAAWVIAQDNTGAGRNLGRSGCAPAEPYPAKDAQPCHICRLVKTPHEKVQVCFHHAEQGLDRPLLNSRCRLEKRSVLGPEQNENFAIEVGFEVVLCGLLSKVSVIAGRIRLCRRATGAACVVGGAFASGSCCDFVCSTTFFLEVCAFPKRDKYPLLWRDRSPQENGGWVEYIPESISEWYQAHLHG